MSAVLKDLNYYLKNPDEMPTDPKEIERIANEHMAAAMESGTEQINVDSIVGELPKDEIKAESSDAKTEVKTEAAPAAEAKTEPEVKVEAEAKPDGILAKDGKNVIPYSQLESARQRATQAEALVKEQADKIAALEAKGAPVEDVALLTDVELETLEADSPALAKVLRAQQDTIRKLTETVQGVTERQAADVEQQATEIKSEIQTAIDSNPTLAAWQTAEDQTMWAEASKFDRLLRESPKYADVPFADRFAKVVELTQAAQGMTVEIPAKEEVALTPEQIRAAAEAKLKKTVSIPRSLSDIPGGAPPAVDEKEKVEQMSSVALGQSFLGMTREQLDAYLATL